MFFLKSLLKAKTKFTGPLSHGKVRTKKDIIAATNSGLTDLALLGEGYVKKQLYKGHGVVTGHLRASVSGGLQKNLVAVVDAGEQAAGQKRHLRRMDRNRGQGNDVQRVRNVQGRQGQIRPIGFQQIHRKGHHRETWLDQTFPARSRRSCRRSTVPDFRASTSASRGVFPRETA